MAKHDFSETKKTAQDTIDDILIGLKSAGKTIDDMITDYNDTLPNKINIDLLEGNVKFYLRADIPGASKESVNIEIKDESVSIVCEFTSFEEEISEKINASKEAQEEKEENKEVEETTGEEVKEQPKLKSLVKGRASSTTKRVIKLPSKIVPEETDAQYDKGTVTLIIPKEPPKTYNVTIE